MDTERSERGCIIAYILLQERVKEQHVQLGNENMGITLFEEQPIRRAWHDGRWFYSVIDIVAVLVPGTNPRKYWFDMKRNVKNEDFVQAVAKCQQFRLAAPDGKLYETDCAEAGALITIMKMIPALRRRIQHGREDEASSCGIYAIVNTVTGEKYIGSSQNITSRFVSHRSDLRRGTHHSSPLQIAWNRLGEEAFLFLILEEVSDIADLEAIEQIYLDTAHPAYNHAVQATNTSILKPIEEGKVHRLIAFLRELAGVPVDGPLSQTFQFLIDHGIAYPGPSSWLLAEAEQDGISTWVDFKAFLVTAKPSHIK